MDELEKAAKVPAGLYTHVYDTYPAIVRIHASKIRFGVFRGD